MQAPVGSGSSQQVELLRFRDEQSLACAVAERWLRELERHRGADYFVALSGGRVARRFFESIASLSAQFGDALTKAHFFWADERCVPPDDPESNFAAAQKNLFEPVTFGLDRIHRIRGEKDGRQAAREAELEIKRLAPTDSKGQPVLDMVFLGMGEDGHVASLFPTESQEVISDPAVYRSVVASKPPPYRVTLGYTAIAAARQVWVLASGFGKERALKESLSTDRGTPLARVINLRQQTLIFTDILISGS